MMKVITFLLFLIFTNLCFAQVTWYAQNSGTNNYLFGVSFVDQNNGWVCGGYPLLLHTTNGGENWSPQSVPTEAYISVYFNDLQNGWLGIYDGKIYHTSDGGQTWNVQYNGGTQLHINSIYFINSDTGWAVGGSPPIFPNNIPNRIILGTSDGGNNWNIQYYQQYEGELDKIFMIDENNGYAIAGAYLMHTTNGGNLWTEPYTFTGYPLNSVFFVNLDEGFACGKNNFTDVGAIFKTSDGGNTWTGTELGVNEYLSDIDFIDEMHGWAVGYNEDDSTGIIYYTSDAGASWNLQNTPPFNAFYAVQFVNSSKGWAVGYQGTIAATESFTPVELSNSTVPAAYVLAQNYPNPFNPSTTIEYSIPESGNVKLQVYNSLGEEVATLVNNYKVAGNYKVNFNAGKLSSGIYYYRISTGNYSSVKKMILLK